jgi:hypothetical protein
LKVIGILACAMIEACYVKLQPLMPSLNFFGIN